MVHVSGFPEEVVFDLEEAKPLLVLEKQFVVLGFVFDNNYLDKAYRRLQSKCKDGYIGGITTQFSTSHGFLSWTNKVLMKGYCLVPPEKDTSDATLDPA